MPTSVQKDMLEKEPVYAIYKNFPPARIKAVEKRGKKIYLLLSWTNHPHLFNRWVNDKYCTEYVPTGKPVQKTRRIQKTRVKLNWFQNLIVKLQNWWYGFNRN
jgi:hypothetical protein